MPATILSCSRKVRYISDLLQATLTQNDIFLIKIFAVSSFIKLKAQIVQIFRFLTNHLKVYVLSEKNLGQPCRVLNFYLLNCYKISVLVILDGRT